MARTAAARKRRRLEESHRLLARARRCIPSTTQTFSKCPTQFVQGVAPNYLVSGKGSVVRDADGNEYLDYILALCPIVLGYAYPAVDNAVRKQLNDGVIFSLPHPLEITVAEKLIELIPCAEMVRFAKNGSDATSGAVRAARAYTGRDRIAMCGYHGWQDWSIGTTTRNKGVPKAVRELTSTFTYNDIDSLHRLFKAHRGEFAAVIMEPVGLEPPRDGFLHKVRELATRHGALLVFDEIVTGFRWALGGAQEFFGVTPDLACFGKAMANGFPIAAVVGKADVMQVFDEIFFSFTFGGEVLSLAAACATIDELKRTKALSVIWQRGKKLQDGLNNRLRKLGLDKVMCCKGYPPRTVITFTTPGGKEWLELKSLFQQEVIERGILSAGGHNLCYSHTDKQIEYTLDVYDEVLPLIAEAVQSGDVLRRLKGKPVEPVFRRP